MVLRVAPGQASMVDEQQHGQRQGPDDVFRQARISHCNNMAHHVVSSCSSAASVKPSMARIQYEFGTELPYDYVTKDSGPSSGNLELSLSNLPKNITVKAAPRFGAIMMAASVTADAAAPTMATAAGLGLAPDWSMEAFQDLDTPVVPTKLSPRIRADGCTAADGPMSDLGPSGWSVAARSASTTYPGPGLNAAAVAGTAAPYAGVAKGRLRRLSATDVPTALLYTARSTGFPSAAGGGATEYGGGPSSTGCLGSRGGATAAADGVGGLRDAWTVPSPVRVITGERGGDSVFPRGRTVSNMPYSASDTAATGASWSGFASPGPAGSDAGPCLSPPGDGRQGGFPPMDGRSGRVTFSRGGGGGGGGQPLSPLIPEGGCEEPLFPNASADSFSYSIPGCTMEPAPPVHYPIQRRPNLQLSVALQCLSNDGGGPVSGGGGGGLALRPKPPSLASPMHTGGASSPSTPADRPGGVAAGVAALMEAVSDSAPLQPRLIGSYLTSGGSASFAWGGGAAAAAAAGPGTIHITRHHTLPTAATGGSAGSGMLREGGCASGPSSNKHLAAGPAVSGGGMSTGVLAAAMAAGGPDALMRLGIADTVSSGGGVGVGGGGGGEARAFLALTSVVSDGESDYDEDYTSPFVLASEQPPAPAPAAAAAAAGGGGSAAPHPSRASFLPNMGGGVSPTASSGGGGGGAPAGAIAAAGAALSLPAFKHTSLGVEDRLTPASPTALAGRLPTSTSATAAAAAAAAAIMQPPASPHRRIPHTPTTPHPGPSSPLPGTNLNSNSNSSAQLLQRTSVPQLQVPPQLQQPLSPQTARRRTDGQAVSPGGAGGGGARDADASPGAASPSCPLPSSLQPDSSQRQRFASLIGLGGSLGGGAKRQPQPHPSAEAARSGGGAQQQQQQQQQQTPPGTANAASVTAAGHGHRPRPPTPGPRPADTAAAAAAGAAVSSSLSPSSSSSAAAAAASRESLTAGRRGGGGGGKGPSASEISPEEHKDIMARMKAALSFLRRGD